MNGIPEALERLLPLKLRENTEMYRKIQDTITSAKICIETQLLDMSRDEVKVTGTSGGYVDGHGYPFVCVVQHKQTD
jgi:hypothetical protein